jgi:hypothetical protein
MSISEHGSAQHQGGGTVTLMTANAISAEALRSSLGAAGWFLSDVTGHDPLGMNVM